MLQFLSRLPCVKQTEPLSNIFTSSTVVALHQEALNTESSCSIELKKNMDGLILGVLGLLCLSLVDMPDKFVAAMSSS